MYIELSVKKTLFTASGELPLAADISIEKGEMTAVSGPSGAGKTTLLRMIAGLTEPDEGRISVNGKDWFNSSSGINVPARKRSAGLVFQDYALFPNMTVLENIKFAQPVPDKKEADELLQLFGLDLLRNRKPSVLSGGQKQRAALARAIARKPEILLLDEPLSALDAAMRRTLQDEILHIHKLRGITAVLVSHDMQEIFRLCRRVITLQEGTVTGDGTPEQIFAGSRNDSATGLVTSAYTANSRKILTVETDECSGPDTGDEILLLPHHSKLQHLAEQNTGGLK